MTIGEETAMAAALKAAGVDTVGASLRVLAVEHLRRYDDTAMGRARYVEAAATMLMEIWRQAAEDMHGDKLPGVGHRMSVDGACPALPTSRQPVAAGEGHVACAQQGQPAFAPPAAPDGGGVGRVVDANKATDPLPPPSAPHRGGAGHQAVAGNGQSNHVRPAREPRGLTAIAAANATLAKGWLRNFALPGGPSLSSMRCRDLAGMSARMIREAAERGHAAWLVEAIVKIPSVQTAIVSNPDLTLGDVLDAGTWAAIEAQFTPERFKTVARDILRTTGQKLIEENYAA